MTLLAFEDANQSPLAELMDVTQRQKTASELNAAILSSQCQVRETSGDVLCSANNWLHQKVNQMFFFDVISVMPRRVCCTNATGRCWH